jgi:hypothetical protein
MDNTTPTLQELEADPEIAVLLDFTPVPRKLAKADGWTPDMQRMFIAWLAFYGSPTKACDELGKARSGIDKVYKAGDADEFRAAWDAAVALAEKRRIAGITSRHGGAGAIRAPAMSRGHKQEQHGPLPGQVMNEYGEWEDEDSIAARAEGARENICRKLLRIRRLYLQEISACPGKRAAFEILTGLPIDWDIASRGEPQPDEPYRPKSERKPDAILLAESGWSYGELGYGPDRKAEARAAMDKYHEEEGLPPIDWNGDA